MSPTTCCCATVDSVETAIACRHAFTKRKMANMSIEVINTAIITSRRVNPRALCRGLTWLWENIKCQGPRLLLAAVDPRKVEGHLVQSHDVLFLLVLPLQRSPALFQGHPRKAVLQLRRGGLVIQRHGP